SRLGLGRGTQASILDAHDETALARFFATVARFDHLVSMVGDSMAGGFLETSPDTMRHVMQSKFWTNWMIARHSAPKVRRASRSPPGRGVGRRTFRRATSPTSPSPPWCRDWPRSSPLERG